VNQFNAKMAAKVPALRCVRRLLGLLVASSHCLSVLMPIKFLPFILFSLSFGDARMSSGSFRDQMAHRSAYWVRNQKNSAGLSGVTNSGETAPGTSVQELVILVFDCSTPASQFRTSLPAASCRFRLILLM